MINLYFLGTRGWFPHSGGQTPCILIETDGAYCILDAGTGIQHLDSIIKTEKPIFLFLSHLHLDHTQGLHLLSRFRFPQGLTLLCPDPYLDSLRVLFNSPFTCPPECHDMPLNIQGLSGIEALNTPFTLETARLRHSDPCWGYRFTLGQHTLCYLTDTAWCHALEDLSRNATLAIVECALPLGQTSESHLNAAQAIQLAQNGNVKTLVLTHFLPEGTSAECLRGMSQGPGDLQLILATEGEGLCSQDSRTWHPFRWA
jgi:ribonuclease BN (tRNA processing enzyme)